MWNMNIQFFPLEWYQSYRFIMDTKLSPGNNFK
jgi:hypothetical protein